jgi:tRNA G46 methylase TrmB
MIGALPGISQTPDNSDDRSSQYDVVPYPSHAYPETHPDRLKVMAVLFGLDPPPVETSRILEIGCGDGSNIIPIAFSLPQADCVGIDFACKPIEASQSLIRRTGIENHSCPKQVSGV